MIINFDNWAWIEIEKIDDEFQIVFSGNCGNSVILSNIKRKYLEQLLKDIQKELLKE